MCEKMCTSHWHYPSDAFFRIAGEVGNDVVFGIDSHEVDHIGNGSFAAALELCERCGIMLLPEVPLVKPRYR